MRWNEGKGPGVTWLNAHLEHEGDECLIWPYTRNRHGYGMMSYLGKLGEAHRFMCIFVNGEPPTPEHQAAHSCGNGHLGCVHPKHLAWRTPFQNRMESNEHGTGKPPAPRRLTIEDVEAIRKRTDGYYTIAADYGVHRDTIGKIMRGETWVNPRSKLTKDQIRRIRSKTDNVQALADELGMTIVQIYRIRDGATHQGVK